MKQKHIMIVGLVIFGISKSFGQSEKEVGFISLFNGKDLSGWIDETAVYHVEDSCIVMRPTQEMGGNLYSENIYGDFILKFDFLLTPAANNGLGIRHDKVSNDRAYSGMELQILDNDDPQYHDLKPDQYHGSIYGIAPAKKGFLKKTGQWNTQEVTAIGDDITVKLNGVVILQVNLKKALEFKAAQEYSKAVVNPVGHIAFLGHGSVVKFKNISIKPL